jgi:dienelactone hydrolase
VRAFPLRFPCLFPILFLTLALTAVLAPSRVSAQAAHDVSFRNRQGIELSGKLFLPRRTRANPAVVLLHGCSGIYSRSDPERGLAILYREWAARLTRAGYVVLLPDSFGPRGSQQRQCGNGRAGVSEVTDRPDDAHAARAFLQSGALPVDPSRIVLLGWSHGGSSVLASLAQPIAPEDGPTFRGGIAFYPGCGLYNAFDGISTSGYVPHAPVLILHGDADSLYRSGHCARRAERANATSQDTGDIVEITVYAGATHGFANARRRNRSFDETDRSARERAVAAAMARLGELTAR